mgnify:CR=1 FL=1|tara:strand:+ start:118 stop:288 length:171 start_codon:yes stop_codon:yes gene_type:complete
MKDRRHYKQWKGGKGSADRTNDLPRYRLGLELIRIKDKYGEDSDEYRQAVKEWKKA